MSPMVSTPCAHPAHTLRSRTHTGAHTLRSWTHTYIFLDHVLAQPPLPEGFPPVWQPDVSADYAVASSVASKRWRGTL